MRQGAYSRHIIKMCRPNGASTPPLAKRTELSLKRVEASYKISSKAQSGERSEVRGRIAPCFLSGAGHSLTPRSGRR
jgi:hypothetical protein